MIIRQQSIATRLLFGIVTFVVLFALAEMGVRLAGIDVYFQNRFFTLNRALDYPEVFFKDRNLFWRLRPSQTITSRFFEGKTYTMNSRGLRDPEIEPAGERQTLLALGNSCTFGWGEVYDSTFVGRLNTRMADRYRVIDAGIPGYTSYQGRVFYETELADLNADILLILFAWNDHWAAANEIADKDQQFPPDAIIAVQNALSHSHFYRLTKKLLLQAIENEPDSLFSRTAPVYRVYPVDYYVNLYEICATARERNTRPILMTSPIPSLQRYFSSRARSGLHAYHEFYNQMVRRLAAEQRIDLIDLAAEFNKHDSLWNDPQLDPIHFNARGHALAADMIETYIDSL